MTKSAPVPFAEGSSSTEIAGLTVENGTLSIVLYGQAEFTRDQAGLAQARTLSAFLQQVVAVLEADPTLAAAVPPARTPGRTKNPFS